MTSDSQPNHLWRHIPSGIWVLGFVSLLMDVSSEMIHSLLPLFMVTVLGTSTIAVGLVEGLAESLALVVKVFSGTLSDYLGRRKGAGTVRVCLGRIEQTAFRRGLQNRARLDRPLERQGGERRARCSSGCVSR